MKKSYIYIALAYGIFLGWLLSFPYNGPVLKNLLSIYNLPIAPFSLTYTIAPVIFLLLYAFTEAKERYAKSMMTYSIMVCFIGTYVIFNADPTYWFPFLAIMGICSVLYIIGWSYFYTMEIPIAQKMPVMALVIITGNLVYYFINILADNISSNFLLVIMLSLLGGSMAAAIKTRVNKKIYIHLEQEKFPTKLIFVMCLFLFAINVNDGLTFHAIYPSFDRLFVDYFRYYGILPYIATLLIMYFYGRKNYIMFPVFLGTSFLGLAYLSFGLLNENWYSYFITETFLQAGWALLDLVLWTLFGLVASIYGRPLKICGFAFLANLFGVFVGGFLEVQILGQLDNYYLISAFFAIGIIFISLIIVHWLNQIIEKDLRNKLIITTSQQSPSEELSSLSICVPNKEILTPREREIAELLVQGYTNMQVADRLSISENTMKTHTKNIYSKLNVANKRELLQMSLSSKSSSEVV